MPIHPRDITIDGVGYMVRAQERFGPMEVVGDLAPQSSRATDGEADFVRFEADSNHAVSDWSGGVGQANHDSANAGLTGLANGRFGMLFPALASVSTTRNGGPHLARLGTSLWAYQTGTTIQNAVTASTGTKASGTPDQKPVASGNGFHWFSMGGNMYRWSGSGSAVDVSPDGHTIVGAATQGRHVFGFGTRVLPTTTAVVQQDFTAGSAGSVALTWDSPTDAASTLVAIITWSNEGEPDISGTADPFPTAVRPLSPAWKEVEGFHFTQEADPRVRSRAFIIEDSLANSYGDTSGMNRERRSRGGTETFEVVTAAGERWACSVHGYMAELEGVRYGQYGSSLGGGSSATGLATTAVSTGSVTSITGAIKISVLAYADADVSHAITPAANWTEQNEASVGELRASVSTTTNNSTNSNSATLGAAKTAVGGLILTFHPIGLTITQGVIIATSDNGETWIAAPTDYSTDVIGTPKAFVAALDSLFFTTEYGLYRMRYLEREYNDGLRTINIGIVQLQNFSYYGTGGNWLCHGLQGVYYSLGSTLWRWSQGGGAEQVWPTPSWATVTGTINFGVMAENVLYFSAAGYLWAYDGHSFHPIGAIASSYIAAEWHNGSLYCSQSAAAAIQQFDFGSSPSSRPDIAAVPIASIAGTSYWVSSRLDWHKVNVPKLIKMFEAQAKFTSPTNSGSVALHYLKACDNTVDPGFAGGGATGLSWVSIGSFTAADPSPWDLELTDAFPCHALYLRITLTKGSAGYPYLQYWSIPARTLMPYTRRVQVTLDLSTGLLDNAGTVVYPALADSATALAALRTLRHPDPPRSFNIVIDDLTTDGETLEVTMSSFSWQKMLDRERAGVNPGTKIYATCVFDELPRE